jgi:hypothetical protein
VITEILKKQEFFKTKTALRARHSHLTDKWGIVISLICTLHCVLTPLAFAILPIMGKFYWAHPAVHFILSAIALPVGFSAFYKGLKRHRKKTIFFSGLFFLSAIVLVPIMVHIFQFNLNESWLMAVSGFGLVVSHYYNYKTCGCPH